MKLIVVDDETAMLFDVEDFDHLEEYDLTKPLAQLSLALEVTKAMERAVQAREAWAQ